jgi:hypothetical protein
MPHRPIYRGGCLGCVMYVFFAMAVVGTIIALIL